MVGRIGKWLDHSGSVVKVRLFQEAKKFCAEKDRIMLLVNSTGQDAGYATWASAEIQFRCVLPTDPRISK